MLVILVAVQGCQGLFFHPADEHYTNPEELFGYDYEDVWFESSDSVRLHGWFIPAQKTEPIGTIVHFHGNAQNISAHIATISWLPEKGFNIFTFDYRGFGKSEGNPTITGVHADGIAAIETAIEQWGEKQGGVLVIGQSLGASVAITSSAKIDGDGVTGIIAENPFESYRGIARDTLSSFWLTWPVQHPLSWLVNDDYAPRDYLYRLESTPVLYLISGADEIVPPSHGKSLYERTEGPRHLWVVEGARHYQAMANVEMRRELRKTIEKWKTEESK